MAEPTGSVLVVIPTYNERDNLEPLLARLHAAVPEAHVLVVDDAARTAPASWPTSWPPTDERVRVLHRTGQGRAGRGLPGRVRAWRCSGELPGRRRDGRRRLARARGPAGAARRARATPTSCSARGTCPAAGWSTGRRTASWLSRGGNLYSRLALGVPIRDITGGFRAFRREVLEELHAGRGRVAGLLLPGRPGLAGAAGRVPGREVPITFTERERGASKMSSTIVAEALWRVTSWGVRASLVPAAPARDAGRHRYLHPAMTKGPDLCGPALVRCLPQAVRPARRRSALSAIQPVSGDLGAALREQLEALVEQHLQVGDRAALQEHVPVRARGLGLLLLGLARRRPAGRCCRAGDTPRWPGARRRWRTAPRTRVRAGTHSASTAAARGRGCGRSRS